MFVDCDPGIDDAVALAYLAARPEVEIVGIGAVFGNNAVDVTAQNALRLLDLYDRPDVPVAVGATRPLVQEPRLAGHVHGGNGLGDVKLPDPVRAPVPETAAELLVRLVRENPGEIDVLAVGPLTNLALALGLEPRLPALVRRLVVMGGAVEVPGNVSSHAEANIANDPEAAEAVFAAGFDLDIVALDITMRTVATGSCWTGSRRSPARAHRRRPRSWTSTPSSTGASSGCASARCTTRWPRRCWWTRTWSPRRSTLRSGWS